MPSMLDNTSRFPIKKMKYLCDYDIMSTGLQNDLLHTEKRNYDRER